MGMLHCALQLCLCPKSNLASGWMCQKSSKLLKVVWHICKTLLGGGGGGGKSWKEISALQLEIERHNRTRATLSSLRSVCFVCRLVVLLPNFVVVIEHIKFLWNHSVWTSNITDIDRDGWNITRRWCHDSYIFPRDNIFPQCCALRENITLLAVHRNVIFHDRPGQYLYINPLARTWLPLWNAKCKHNAIDLFTNFMHTILACLRFERRSNNSCIRKVDSN